MPDFVACYRLGGPLCRPEERVYGGSTIGVTGENVSHGAFPQEKPRLSKAGWGTVIVESA
jgi:hypothetical protein